MQCSRGIINNKKLINLIQQNEINELKVENTLLKSENTLIKSENTLIKSKLNKLLAEAGKDTI